MSGNRKSITVRAILVGSSNQSQITYFEKAAKGEADVLMLDDGELPEKIRDAENSNDNIGLRYSELAGKCAVFESMDGKDPGEYFKSILKDLLENS